MQYYQFLPVGDIPRFLKDSFNDLPPDLWLKPKDSHFRFRCYQQAVLKSQQFSYLNSNMPFYQPSHLNCYSGGVKREYAGLVPDVADIVFDSIISRLVPILPDKEYQIGIHQIRITTDSLNIGHPAPEGIHQDGFTYISVCCIELNNVSGGDTTLIPCDKDTAKVVTFKLNEGEAVVFNDVNYLHYTSAIVPLLPGKGYRDVFVITFDDRVS
ncbi:MULTISPECIES: 2OG-Fe dioxygenase family protein [unclassified Symbiopectobacterium]|uniref:2OG-Fe dioxygenase family protein n=1 Tax=unclassified Symbiopectobacterium TaxID=2794573 RepID=UPI002227FD3E|nr:MULTISPECIES: 2OG-Fe dioxygenase family protein [unclassified Symbiopectobacterium]MCW2476740.1 2OG-Fe dioxygenase family protein [Candidatus Symbiopectobacterium sp. NZEC151]MCW2482372.1 2OG-Fe dioxygenase family protein [Candidatus Symbiopectobacterium sp. NZEC135]